MEIVSIKDYPLCSSCNKPLSVAPIYHNDSIGNVCGRCMEIVLLNTNKDLKWERQNALERIANYLRFPCTYRIFGCPTALTWDMVETHEKSCSFHTIVCPLSHEFFMEKCKWIDKHSELEEHIKQKHKSMICTLPTMKITERCENNIMFWEIRGQLIIIILIFNEKLKKYSCYVAGKLSPYENHIYRCQVTVHSDDRSSSLVVGTIKMQPFSLNHLGKTENSVIIDIDHYLKHFAKNELTLTFDVLEEASTVVDEFNEKLLQELECPICVDYMKPPIFICQAGHNICEVCCKKLDNCPLCRGHLLGGRNFTLETLCSKIHYPCSNKPLGCSFVALHPQIKDHQYQCEYAGRKCFLENCNWKGFESMFKTHLEKNHSDVLLKTGEIKIHESNRDIRNYLLLHNDEIFVLKFFNTNEHLKFAVLHFESKKGDKAQFIYSLKLLEHSSIGLNIAFSNCSQAVPYNSDILDYEDCEVTSIPFSLLTQFLLNSYRLAFELSIECEST